LPEGLTLFHPRASSPRVDVVLENVPLEQIELAPNPRRDIDPDGIDDLARMLSRGQVIPTIGERLAAERVVIYDGQRRLLAARRTHELAGTGGFEDVRPVPALIVMMLDHAPDPAELLRLQAAANAHEQLSLQDLQALFADCWRARASLPEPARIAMVCADIGIGHLKGHNLRRQLSLPERIRQRVSEKRVEDRISPTLANKLAEINEISPELAGAVADRIATPELHEKALRDLGAFVHRAVIEDHGLYAVRIDDGALLDCAAELAKARGKLTDLAPLAQALGVKEAEIDKKLDQLERQAREGAAKLRVEAALRDRAIAGRFAYSHDRGRDFAPAVWVTNPAFLIDAVRTHLEQTETPQPPQEETYFHTAGVGDQEMRDAAAKDHDRKARERERRLQAQRSNYGLGDDLRAGLTRLSRTQIDALRTIVCQVLARHYGELIAYGAGWSDLQRQRPIGETGRVEPQPADEILRAELNRATGDPDPLSGIAQLAARLCVAFVLDPAGVSRTKQLGHERMTRKVAEALPAGDRELRGAIWEYLRPMLSPRLVEMHRDEFVANDHDQSTVDLDAHRADINLADLDLGEEALGSTLEEEAR
jgi:hypothetical protein